MHSFILNISWRKQRLIILAVFAALVMSVPGASRGQAGPAQNLEITPVKHELTITPSPNAVLRDVAISNRNTKPTRLRVRFSNILPNGIEGEVKPVEEATPWDLRRFTRTLQEEITLAPGETRKVAVAISVPPSTAPGGYYGVLRFTSLDAPPNQPVAIQGEIGALFLVRVPGPAEEKGAIKSFAVNRDDGRKLGFFSFDRQIRTQAIIANSGNVHFPAKPEFSLKNVVMGSTNKVAVEENNVFPKGERRFESGRQKVDIGFTKVTVDVGLPGGKQSQSQTILVLPWLVLVIGLLSLAVLIAVVVYIRRLQKRLNRP